MGSKKPFIVVGIPAYDEEGTIPKVIVRAQRHVDRVIVCDDGSTDETAEIAKRLGADVLRHERNLGYGSAIRSLFREAKRLRADVFVTMDADGQHDPEDISKLTRPILEGKADIVVGSRFLSSKGRRAMPRYRRFGIEGLTELTKRVSGVNVTDAQSGFRAYGKRAFESIVPSEQGMGASTEILIKAAEKGLVLTEEPITVAYEGAEPTHNPIYHLLDVSASTIKFVSIRHPLIFYGVPGLIALLLGIAFGAWAVHLYTVQGEFAPGVTLLSLAATLTGLLMIFTSIILFTLITVLKERAI